MLLCDLWTDIDFQNTQNEGGVSFPSGKKPEKLIFPHNVAKNDSWVYQMYGLYNTAIELGGTIYKVAEDSDFLSAFEYMEAWMNPKRNEMVLVTAVIECFVQLEESGEEEQIFLYSPL